MICPVLVIRRESDILLSAHSAHPGKQIASHSHAAGKLGFNPGLLCAGAHNFFHYPYYLFYEEDIFWPRFQGQKVLEWLLWQLSHVIKAPKYQGLSVALPGRTSQGPTSHGTVERTPPGHFQASSHQWEKLGDQRSHCWGWLPRAHFQLCQPWKLGQLRKSLRASAARSGGRSSCPVCVTRTLWCSRKCCVVVRKSSEQIQVAISYYIMGPNMINHEAFVPSVWGSFKYTWAINYRTLRLPPSMFTIRKDYNWMN